jgi:hypothetical protein
VSIFKRRIREDAAAVDRPGIDEFSPANVDDELWKIGTQHVPMSTHNIGTPHFEGTLESPVPQSPPVSLATDAPPLLIDTHYARVRSGEGVWGMESLIPEGETR